MASTPEPDASRAEPEPISGSGSGSLPASVRRSSTRWTWIKRVGRVLLFVLGVTAVVLLVREAGPDRVLATLLQAGPWLPVILLLECAFMGMDVVALRGLLGRLGKGVPLAVWVRTALLQYGVMVLLPAGRAGGEVARAAGLSPYVGGGARAAAAATRLQAATMFGNSIISIPCAVGVALAVEGSVLESPLFWAIVVNGLITSVIGGAIVLASRKSSFGGWLGRKIPLLASSGPSFDAALRDGTPWTPAFVATAIGRSFQTLQYGLILLAVGGTLTLVSALVSQGIHLVGAGMGDMVPNQAGITEGAYTLFAPALGLEHDLAKAIGIALVARICQFSLAATCLVVSAIWKGSAPEGSAENAPAGAP